MKHNTNKVKLTESQLKKVITEAVKKIINEEYFGNSKTFIPMLRNAFFSERGVFPSLVQAAQHSSKEVFDKLCEIRDSIIEKINKLSPTESNLINNYTKGFVQREDNATIAYRYINETIGLFKYYFDEDGGIDDETIQEHRMLAQTFKPDVQKLTELANFAKTLAVQQQQNRTREQQQTATEKYNNSFKGKVANTFRNVANGVKNAFGANN